MGSTIPPTPVSQRGGGYFFAAIYGLLLSHKSFLKITCLIGKKRLICEGVNVLE